HFLGAPSDHIQREGVYPAQTLAHSAEVAVALLNGQEASPVQEVTVETQSLALNHALRLGKEQRYVRGVFAGGTFCFEAQLICHEAGITG
ncbi:hypothetical protein Q5762_38555, partial [Streptomyces sp. P9(2023)]